MATRTNTRVEQLLALMRVMVGIIEENGGVMKMDEAHLQTAGMSYVGINCVADKWLELSYRHGTYTRTQTKIR